MPDTYKPCNHVHVTRGRCVLELGHLPFGGTLAGPAHLYLNDLSESEKVLGSNGLWYWIHEQGIPK